jgi:hypothetical protein
MVPAMVVDMALEPAEEQGLQLLHLDLAEAEVQGRSPGVALARKMVLFLVHESLIH